MSLFDEIRQALSEAGLLLKVAPEGEQSPIAVCDVAECEKSCKDCIIISACKSVGCQQGGCRVKTKVGEVQFEPTDPVDPL